MPSPTDARRIAVAHTPLGNKLVFREMYGREQLSGMFEYRVEFLAEDDSGIDPHDVLGREITIELKTQAGPRYVSGQCTRFAYVGREPGVGRYSSLWRYEARLRPWIWYLTRESDCRIFQKETVPRIIRHIFAKYSFPVDIRLSAAYREMVYCVQYQETDFNFVSRLMEQEGIYYWFEHSMGQHMLVVADDIGAHSTLPGYGTIPCIPSDLAVRPNEEWIDDWEMAREVRSGQYVTNDFDWEHPSANLVVVQSNPQPFPNSERQMYEWPGGYTRIRDGEDYGRARMEELQQPKEVTTARSSARGLAAGYLFTLEKCPRADQNREYLLLDVECEVRDNPYHGTDEEPAKWSFRLKAQPTTFPYRPPRTTPKPRSTGPQTAVVVGPPDEEIWTNEHGEVKVRFWWDNTEQNIENSEYDRTCWIRVSSGWAGSNWGMISIPRIGQEVIVDFLYGDLDFPIIIGRVYNAEHKPPYVLPRWKEYSTWKSRSTKHGGNNDWNELRFYDYKGKEQVFIHANWRMDVRVKWNKYLTVKESYHIQVGKGSYRTTGGNVEEYIGGDYYLRAKGDIHVTTPGTINVVTDSGLNLTSKMSIQMDAMMPITLSSDLGVTMRCGSNFISVTPIGVTIQGTMVLINSGGSGSTCSPFEAQHPVYASEADTGEPGYLDRPHTGGGGWKRGSSSGGTYGSPAPSALGMLAAEILKSGGGAAAPVDPGQEKYSDGITIKGDKAYRDAIRKQLDDMQKGPVGKKIVDDLDRQGRDGKGVVIKHDAGASPGTTPGDATARLAKETSKDPATGKITVTKPGAGTSSVVDFPPDLGKAIPAFAKYPDGKDAPPNQVPLGHELIHAVHNGDGTNLRSEEFDGDPSGQKTNHEEAQTMGIGPYSGDEMTENALRKEAGHDRPRTSHAKYP